MNRLLLFAIFLVGGWYVWWRMRRRIAALMASIRRPPEKSRAPSAMTLQKDPLTGVYRPPKS